jgi:plasmid replication initiation protein
LLVQWSSKGERELELTWLKHVLDLSEKYPRTNNFIQRIIKPSVEEINAHSNLTVRFGTRKTGRTITHLQFKFDIKEMPNQKQNRMTIEQFVRENPSLTRGKSTVEVLKLMKSSYT